VFSFINREFPALGALDASMIYATVILFISVFVFHTRDLPKHGLTCEQTFFTAHWCHHSSFLALNIIAKLWWGHPPTCRCKGNHTYVVIFKL